MSLAALQTTEMDFIIFVQGMAFILLALVCFFLKWRDIRGLPWTRLGMFGLLHGIGEWTALVTFFSEDTPVFRIFRAGLMAASFLFLLEFARAGMHTWRSKTPGRWILLPLFAAGIAGAFAGIDGFNAACRYSMGFTGAIGAAAALAGNRRPSRQHQIWLLIAAMAMALYAIAAGLIVPNAGFFPAASFNQTSFQDMCGIPIQALRAFCAMVIAGAIWIYSERRYERRMADAGLPLRNYHPVYVAAFFVTIAGCGWFLTSQTGSRSDAANRKSFLSRAQAAGCMLEPEWVNSLAGTPQEESDPAYIKKELLLTNMCNQEKDVRFAYVMAYRAGRIVFLVDAQPRRSYDPADDSHSGDLYDESTSELKALFGGGDGFVEGPVADRWGTWVSALVPIRDLLTGQTIAVFGMDISANEWNLSVARHRMNSIIITMLFISLALSFVLVLQYLRDATLLTAASEREHRTLVEGSPNGVLLLDQDGRIARVNAFVAEKMGYDKEAPVGRFFAELWPQYARQRICAVLTQAQMGCQASFETESERADTGERVVWEVRLNPVVDRDAHVRRIVCIASDITARREAEAALRASEEKYRTLFESSADGVALMLDTFMDCNDQLCRMWRCSRHDIIGRTPEDFSPLLQPDGCPSAERRHGYVDAAQKGTPQVFYWRHRRQDGTEMDSEISLKSVPVGGRVVTLATVRDITERHREEERLAKINACFLALGSDAYENINRLTALCGELLEASCATYEHMEEGHLRAMSQWNVPPGFPHAGHMCIDVVRNAADPVTVWKNLPESPYAESDERIRRFGMRTYAGKAVKCGGQSIGSLCILYQRDADPGEAELRTVGIIASAIGIEEERLLALRTLADSEERYRAFSDNVPLHLGGVTLNGQFILWNRYSEIMFGYTPEEAISILNAGDLFPQYEEAQQTMKNAIADGIFDGETTMKRRDGTCFPAHLVVVPCKKTSEDAVVFFAFAEDITERKLSEERLRRAKDEAEATNEQLELAVERANRLAFEADMANTAKSQFLANMSHEIRTPMNAIIGMTGLLLDTTLEAEQREFLEIVRNAAESLLALINDILDFSKIEAGKLDLELLDFDLRATVEDTMDMLAIKAHDKGLEFACLIHHDVPSLLRGDPGRLRQILINLCNNAIKFTPKGEVTVRVMLTGETDERATLRFAVSDTGIGIPHDRTDSLFQLFSQLDASTTRKYGGTGLGLAISKRLAELMAGKIGVESEEGVGSTFWFTIVLQKQTGVTQSRNAENPELLGKRILIVDDNATNRLVFREQLRSYGCTSDEAAGGTEALAKLEAAVAQHTPYDAVLVDLLMPEMDGIGLGRRIKANPAIMKSVLIMVTSRGQRGDAKASKAAGFAGYLTKPVRTSHLRDCLIMTMGRKTPPGAPEKAPLVTRHLVSDEKRRLRILLAEDNITNQKVALRILEKQGYRADPVANGKEAVRAVAMASYDLILMDIEMPEMDGFEATAAIRNMEKETGRHIPIIAMTAHALSGHREKCLEAGMDDYVAKPVHPEELFGAIERQSSGMHLAANPIPKAPLPPIGSSKEALAVFDRAGLEARMGGDDDLCREVVSVFVDDLPQQLERLRNAVRDMDIPTARRIAHSIKGAAASIGAEALRAWARQAEEAVGENTMSTVPPLADRIAAAFEELRSTLQHSGFPLNKKG